MALVSWKAASSGHYWIDVALGNREIPWMVDSGLVDPLNRVGFELDPAIYDQLQRTNLFQRYQLRTHRDSSGRLRLTESGLATAQLVDPVTRQRVGPVVQVYVSRGRLGVASRVGVVFFHRLSGAP